MFRCRLQRYAILSRPSSQFCPLRLQQRLIESPERRLMDTITQVHILPPFTTSFCSSLASPAALQEGIPLSEPWPLVALGLLVVRILTGSLARFYPGDGVSLDLQLGSIEASRALSAGGSEIGSPCPDMMLCCCGRFWWFTSVCC